MAPRWSRPTLVALVIGLVCTGMVTAPTAGARPSRHPVVLPHGVATAAGNGLSGRAIPATAGPPQRSCGRAPAGRFSCLAFRRSLQSAPLATGGAPYGLSPADLQSAYALPAAASGAGQDVWIVDAYDDPAAESDLAIYRAQYGLPACTTANGCFRKLDQSGVAGSYPGPDAGWAGEIALDLAMVSATCPNCHITLIEADDPGSGLFTAIGTAVRMGAKYVSMSWGGGESGSEPWFDSQYFDHPGVVFTAASGDGGYGYGVLYPSTSPYVVAVGGTSLRKSTTARGWSETAWGGAGSGCSASETRPTWQTVPVTAVCPRRAVADVAAVADPSTGVAVYQSYGGYGWTVYGGTSAAAPVIASVYALASSVAASDFPVTYPYARPGSLNDVTSGTTGSCSPAVLCTAGVGWDGPTGLGTPAGLAAFGPAAPVVSVTAPGRQSGRVGTATSLALQAVDTNGSPLSWSAVGLPPGLSVAPDTGVVSGTPTGFGSFAVTVTATDADGARGTAGFVWAVASDDVTPPTAALTGPTSAVQTSGSVQVSWSGSDAYTGVAYYQVEYRRSAWNGDYSSWVLPSAWSHLTSSSLVHTGLARGYTYCWAVRAVDRAGNVSVWSAQRCTAVPLDDRSLAAVGAWTRATGSPYWVGTVTSGSRADSSLVRTGALVRRVALVATRCAACGIVGVYVNGRLFARFNLYGGTAYRVVYSLAPFTLRAATVEVRVLSSGRRVQVDGLVLSRA